MRVFRQQISTQAIFMHLRDKENKCYGFVNYFSLGGERCLAYGLVSQGLVEEVS